jgi:hypothetical protein
MICVVIDPLREVFEEVLLKALNITVIVNHNHIVFDFLKLFKVDLGIFADQE